jgi:hypothetical protein
VLPREGPPRVDTRPVQANDRSETWLPPSGRCPPLVRK